MNPIEWNNLSEEAKKALLDTCKEDPVVFIETVCGIDLMEYQKTIIREVFKNLKKQDSDASIWKKYWCESESNKRVVIDISKEVTCRTCKYRDGWYHLEPCRSCKAFSNWEER